MRPEAHRITASYETFVDLLQQVKYPLEYEQGEIVIMSIASDAHEQILEPLTIKVQTFTTTYFSNCSSG